MYYFFMGTMQIPIPPATMTTKIKGMNKTINLINKGEINILKKPGLTTVDFKFLLPNQDYPFNESLLSGSARASYYTDALEKLKTSNEPFQFIVVRMTAGGSLLQMSNMKMTLENYAILEDAKEGYDQYASVELKQWKDYSAKTVTVTTKSDGSKEGVVTSERQTTGHEIPTTAIAKQGETLQTIVKKNLGSIASFAAVKSLNKIAIPAILAVGQAIKLKEQSNVGS